MEALVETAVGSQFECAVFNDRQSSVISESSIRCALLVYASPRLADQLRVTGQRFFLDELCCVAGDDKLVPSNRTNGGSFQDEDGIWEQIQGLPTGGVACSRCGRGVR